MITPNEILKKRTERAEKGTATQPVKILDELYRESIEILAKKEEKKADKTKRCKHEYEEIMTSKGYRIICKYCKKFK